MSRPWATVLFTLVLLFQPLFAVGDSCVRDDCAEASEQYKASERECADATVLGELPATDESCKDSCHLCCHPGGSHFLAYSLSGALRPALFQPLTHPVFLFPFRDASLLFRPPIA